MQWFVIISWVCEGEDEGVAKWWWFHYFSAFLGKLYAVLGKRGGRILHGDLQEGSTMFEVIALLPVVESFDVANEVRRQTSGLSLPQLVFSGWEVSDLTLIVR